MTWARNIVIPFTAFVSFSVACSKQDADQDTPPLAVATKTLPAEKAVEAPPVVELLVIKASKLTIRNRDFSLVMELSDAGEI